MTRQFGVLSVVVLCLASLSAQQKGQWTPGQYGLNAGVIPIPGFTYMNLAMNYSAGQANNSQGNRLPNLTGSYSFWLDENIFMFVPNKKILGGYFAPYANVNIANGNLVAVLTLPSLKTTGGGAGLADTFVAPVNFGWHFSRLDFNAGYAFTAPTGSYSAGASNNVGSGYWGTTSSRAARSTSRRTREPAQTFLWFGKGTDRRQRQLVRRQHRDRHSPRNGESARYCLSIRRP